MRPRGLTPINPEPPLKISDRKIRSGLIARRSCMTRRVADVKVQDKRYGALTLESASN